MGITRSNQTDLVLAEAIALTPKNDVDNIIYNLKMALKKLKYKVVKPETIAKLLNAGVTLDDVRQVANQHKYNRYLLQQLMLHKLKTLHIDETVLEVQQLISLSTLPSSMNNTLEKTVFDAKITKLDTSFAFANNRLVALRSLLFMGIPPDIAFTMTDQNLYSLDKMVNHILSIRNRLFSLGAAMIAEQHENSINKIQFELMRMAQGNSSSYDAKIEYGLAMENLKESIAERFSGLTLQELIPGFFSQPSVQELITIAIEAKETYVDENIMEIILPRIKLRQGYTPTQLADADFKRVYDLKMQLLKNDVIGPWEKNNTYYSLPAPVCPATAACPAATICPSFESQLSASIANRQLPPIIAAHDTQNFNNGMMTGGGIVLIAWGIAALAVPTYNHILKPAVTNAMKACNSFKLLFFVDKNHGYTPLKTIEMPTRTQNNLHIP